jgi:hypothetical protein
VAAAAAPQPAAAEPPTTAELIAWADALACDDVGVAAGRAGAQRDDDRASAKASRCGARAGS